MSHFQSAAEGGRRAEISGLLEVYALGLDGRCGHAHELAAERGLGLGRSERDAQFAAILAEVCSRAAPGGARTRPALDPPG